MKPAGQIRFKATLQRPVEPKRASWAFVLLPATASKQLPSRGQVAIEGQLQGAAFAAVLQPDGQGGHWLQVDKALQRKAKVEVGQTLALQVALATTPPEPKMPADLRAALGEFPASAAQWASLTTAARRDWIHWLDSAKKQETRQRRIANACDMLASGKRRVCCFDRSGMYDKRLSAPKAAE